MQADNPILRTDLARLQDGGLFGVSFFCLIGFSARFGETETSSEQVQSASST